VVYYNSSINKPLATMKINNKQKPILYINLKEYSYIITSIIILTHLIK